MGGFNISSGGVSSAQILQVAENIQYDAVVDAGGGGDYTTISAAIAAGAKSIFVRKGTIVETSDITLSDGFSIIGESVTETIVAFSGSAGFVVDGSSGTKESTGTITVQDGFDAATKRVAGSGTTFTNLSEGDYISVRGIFYEIGTILLNTSLDLVRDHEGFNDSGLSYVAQSMVVGGTFRNMTIANSSKEAIYIRASSGITIDNCLISGNSDGVIIVDSSNIVISRSLIGNNNSASVNPSHGISITDSFIVQVTSCVLINNEGAGIHIDCGEYSNITIDNAVISENRDQGILVQNGDLISITDSVISGNNDEGIDAVVTTINNILMASCMISDNGSDGVKIYASESIIDNCIAIRNNNDGFEIRNNSTVSGCKAFGNGGVGFNLATSLSTDKRIVVGNYARNNGADGFDFGTTTECVLVGNISEGNAGIGFDIDYPASGGNAGRFFEASNFSKNNTGGQWDITARGKKYLQTGDFVELSWYVATPSVGTNVAGFRKAAGVNDTGRTVSYVIDAVFMSLVNRGDTGDTIVDINAHNVNQNQNSQVSNVSGTTIYSTSGNRPTLAGDTSNPTQNAFIHESDPDTVDVVGEDVWFSIDVDQVQTNVAGLTVTLILKRIPS